MGQNTDKIEPVLKVKFPAMVIVWGMMSHCAVSDLNIVPQKQTVNAAYYRNNILEKLALMLLRENERQVILPRGLC